MADSLSDSESLGQPLMLPLASILDASAVSFLERAGLREAGRGPLPALEPSATRVATLPLSPPLPHAELQTDALGAPPPDRGQTGDWPA